MGADIICFPELSLTGYALQDLAASVAHRPRPDDPIFAPLLEASRGLDLVVGFVDEDPRHRFFIAAAYLSGGEVLHVHHKVYLPTYGLFDEGRFFAWGDSIRAFDTRFGRVGIAICEDFWHASPPYLLWLDGADLLIFTSASPGRGLHDDEKLESARWVEHINRAYASLFTAFVAHANRVGYEDGLNFWGGSTVFDPDGKLLGQGPYHEEALVQVEVDLNQLCMCATESGVNKQVIAKAATDAASPLGKPIFPRDEIAQAQCLREIGLGYTPVVQVPPPINPPAPPVPFSVASP
jgi:predicted amidohydrolase